VHLQFLFYCHLTDELCVPGYRPMKKL
jgi:hypothetical protein